MFRGSSLLSQLLFSSLIEISQQNIFCFSSYHCQRSLSQINRRLRNHLRIKWRTKNWITITKCRKFSWSNLHKHVIINCTSSQAFQNVHAISMMIQKKAYGNSTPSQVVNHGQRPTHGARGMQIRDSETAPSSTETCKIQHRLQKTPVTLGQMLCHSHPK